MLSKGTSKLSDKSWIVKLWKIWTAYVFHLRFFFYFTIPDNAWSFSLALRQVLFVWFSIIWLWKFLAVAAFNDANTDSYWNRLIKRKKKTTFRSIYFQIVETELTKHFFFSSYFKVIHDFLKCRSTFVSSGIIIKVCKVRTIVLKSQRSMLNSRRSSIDSCVTS